MTHPHPIILFDGVCNFCNAWVKFILKRDKEGVFRFVPLQSDIGRKLLQEQDIDTVGIDSIMLLTPHGLLTKSDAVIAIAQQLPGLWSAFRILKIFPRSFRNRVYELIAKYRYHFFGKSSECMVPTPAMRSRFLE